MKAVSGTRVRMYWLLAIGLGAVYFAAGIVLPLRGTVDAGIRQRYLFGVSQLELFLSHPAWSVGLLLVTACLFTLLPMRGPSAVAATGPLQRRARLVMVGLLSAGAFFLLRNNFINEDGMQFARKFARDIPVSGAHVTHDEMWELFVHSRFWHWTHGQWGWSVELSYQVLSALAGGLFVVLLYLYARRAFPRMPPLFMLFAVSGGYMQLFFGDVENYTLTSVLVLAYFFAARRHIENGNTSTIPSLLLGTAITFHLLALSLLPSLLYLLYRRWESGSRGEVLRAVGALGGVIGGTLLWFHFHGLHLRNLWYHSHVFGHGGDVIGMLAPLSAVYYVELFSLLLLLMPVVLLLLPDARHILQWRDPVHTHLLVAALGMSLYVLLWEAKLGVRQDWNLYAPAALPWMLLVACYLCREGKDTYRVRPIRIVGALGFLHSALWIIGNHLR